MGERIDQDIIGYIKLLKSEKCELQGTVDPYVGMLEYLEWNSCSFLVTEWAWRLRRKADGFLAHHAETDA